MFLYVLYTWLESQLSIWDLMEIVSGHRMPICFKPYIKISGAV